MTEKTQEWAERVGREARDLGFLCLPGTKWIDPASKMTGRNRERDKKWGLLWPDFRDRLTELACIPWVEDVAREAYGETAHVDIKFGPAGPYEQRVAYCRVIGDDPPPFIVFTCPTLAEACIAAVRAMKGEPC